MQELPKNHILRGYQAFSRVLSQGRKRTSGLIRCFYLPAGGEKKHPRVGFATVQTIRKASERNRVRRLMREAYRLNRDHLFSDGKCPASEIVLLYTDTREKGLRYSVVEREVILLLKGLKEKD